MKSKNAKKGSKNDKVKRNVQTMKKAPGKHSKEEIISEEELDNRIAIDGADEGRKDHCKSHRRPH